MPVKRKYDKERLDPEKECQIFGSIFASGIDFYETLSEIGIHRPNPRVRNSAEKWARYYVDMIEACRSAWHRIGRQWLDQHWAKEKYPQEYHKLWSVEMFGNPQEGSHDK